MSCQKCVPNIRALKTANWDRHDAENLAAHMTDHRDLVVLWAKSEVKQYQHHFTLPDFEELQRRFPMAPQSRRPELPRVEDVRV